MARAAEVVNRALSLIMVQPSEAPIQPDEAATAIEVMNDMMAEWDADGVSVGYSIISSLSDELTVPDYALAAIKSNLAIRLAPEFLETDAPPLLQRNAGRSYDRLVNIVVNVPQCEYPCTLPLGSGNTGNRYNYVDRFYSCPEDEVLNETGGSILLEDQ